MRFDPIALVRLYVLILGVGLLLEGGGLLIADQLGLSVGIGASDTRRNLLYVVSGVALLAIWISARGRAPVRVIWAALVFGALYIALGILGLTINQPFGLQLGPGENVFHFIVGPLALGLGAWALKATQDRPAMPIPIAGPVRRRRPPVERKRPPRRGRSRRR